MTHETIEMTPPPFVERFEYKSLKQINDPVTRKRVYLTPDDEKLPSVTTILSSTKDMTHRIEWRKRVGEANAKRITTEAAGVGTAMHNNLERYVVGEQRQPGNNPVHVQANKMADVIIENGLKHVDEIWSIEQALYFPGLYSGTTDLCGVFKGKPAIMDHKQTNKPNTLKPLTGKAVKTLADSIYETLKEEGCDEKDIIGVSSQLISLVTEKLEQD